uniref:Uncharacterized protein n=1 Tax=mine drainage metagenome TaxID=410659 RepID=E6PLZ6_9ZZZZ
MWLQDVQPRAPSESGGKTQLAPFVSSLLSQNGLQGGHYAEPFAVWVAISGALRVAAGDRAMAQ